MTIKRTAYDTFIGQSHRNTERFAKQVVELDITTGFLLKNAHTLVLAPKDSIDYVNPIFPTVITPVLASENNIVPITFPTLVTVPSVGEVSEMTFLVSDARNYLRGKSLEEVQVTNMRDFAFLRARTILGAIWAGKGTQPIRALSRYLPAMYAFWIADKIAQRFVLDPEEQMIARLIAFHFYNCLHTDNEQIDEDDMRKIATPASRLVFADPKRATALFEGLPHIQDAQRFIEVLRAQLNNPRLDDLNLGTLATLMAATWFQEGKENAVAAIEHPPTFCAMVYSAFSQRGFRDTQLSRTLEKFKGPKGEAEVSHAISALLNA